MRTSEHLRTTCITKWLVSENKEPVGHSECSRLRIQGPCRYLQQDGFITILNNLIVSTHLQYTECCEL
ncbi:MAG: hypothetical protein ACK56F_16930 [bacterium]